MTVTQEELDSCRKRFGITFRRGWGSVIEERAIRNYADTHTANMSARRRAQTLAKRIDHEVTYVLVEG